MDMTVASRQSDGLRAVTPDGCTVADPSAVQGLRSVGRDTGTAAYSTPMALPTFPILTRQGQGHKKGGNALPAESASNTRDR